MHLSTDECDEYMVWIAVNLINACHVCLRLDEYLWICWIPVHLMNACEFVEYLRLWWIHVFDIDHCDRWIHGVDTRDFDEHRIQFNVMDTCASLIKNCVLYRVIDETSLDIQYTVVLFLCFFITVLGKTWYLHYFEKEHFLVRSEKLIMI